MFDITLRMSSGSSSSAASTSRSKATSVSSITDVSPPRTRCLDAAPAPAVRSPPTALAPRSRSAHVTSEQAPQPTRLLRRAGRLTPRIAAQRAPAQPSAARSTAGAGARSRPGSRSSSQPESLVPLAERCARPARPNAHLSPGHPSQLDGALRDKRLRGSHRIHSGVTASTWPSASGNPLPLPAAGASPPARCAAASAFFARLSSRRSLTASSRARFACVCCFLAAIRPPLSVSRAAAAALTPLQLTTDGLRGRRRDVRRLRPLLALFGLVLHLRVLSERLVALADDRAVMNEQILAAVIGGDEPIPLVGVEPLHGSGCHRKTPPLLIRNGQRRRTARHRYSLT